MAVTVSAVGTGLGTSPPAPQLRGNDNSVQGIVGLGTGTSPGTNTLVFSIKPQGLSGDDGMARSGASGPAVFGPVIVFFPYNSATANLTGNWFISSQGLDGTINVGFSGTLAASQAANTYLLGYQISAGVG